MHSVMVAVQARNVARPSEELTLRCIEAAAKRILLEAMIGDLCMEAPADSLSARGVGKRMCGEMSDFHHVHRE